MNRKILIFLIIIILPQYIFAWGKTGHRIIGQISQELIDSTTEKKINLVLNNTDIAMVANWGDFVKSDPKYSNYYTWHYTNLESNLSRYQLDSAIMTTESGECVFQVFYLIEYLKRNPNDADMLKMLIHIVGDMFMPLHMGHAEDKGGNMVKVNFFNENTNLHSLWDEKLIEGENLSYTEYSQYLMKTYNPKTEKFSKEFINNNAWKTYQIQKEIYKDSKITKPYQYIYKYKSVWESQLVAGGVLLAEILNYIYN